MIGKDEKVLGASTYYAVLRSGGAVIVTKSSDIDVTVNNNGSMVPVGTYTDKISGNSFTVTDKTITGHVGSSGIAVFYQTDQPAHVHTPAPAVRENEVPASCTAQGSYDEVIYCTSCGEEISRTPKTVSALGHSLQYVEEIPATPIADGTRAHYVCNRCGKLFADANGAAELSRQDLVLKAEYILGDADSDGSVTILDATFMRMKEDHMRNGQLKPAYNVQIGVESEYIVGIGLYSNPTDTTTLIPFLERLRNNIGRKYTNIIADAGYASEENYTYLEENGQNAYIKPADYEIRKTKKYQKNIYRVENLSYDEIGDYFTCPNGKRLNHAYDGKRKTENGYEVVKSYYICESCESCPHREKCYKGKYENRKISFSKTMARQKAQAAERITADEGNILRRNRSIQVEGAFGIVKQDRDFRRFLTRGKAKTETQFFLIAFSFNINKLHNRTIYKRLGLELFNQEAA